MGYILMMPVCKTLLLNLWVCLIEPIFTQCLYGPRKTGKVLEFYCGMFSRTSLERFSFSSLKLSASVKEFLTNFFPRKKDLNSQFKLFLITK